MPSGAVERNCSFRVTSAMGRCREPTDLSCELLFARHRGTIAMRCIPTLEDMAEPRKLAFILAATDHGTMIVNRFDANISAQQYGVGAQILGSGRWEMGEVLLLKELVNLRHQHYGAGVFAIDCGANIGVQTIELASHMTGWGNVLAIEAQERIYYALAGNIAINNCFNASAVHAAVGTAIGAMNIPTPDYLTPGNFGALELRRREDSEGIGQAVDYGRLTAVPAVRLDALLFERIDLIKLDVEGMEMEVLAGGEKHIAAQRPMMWVEWKKSDKNAMRAWLTGRGYELWSADYSFLAVHSHDKCIEQVRAMRWKEEHRA